MKTREPRRHVVILSRVRCGGNWADARILNISSRGLGLEAAAPPVRGSYVEVRRGQNIIVARVVWVSGDRFGVRSQDPILIDAIIADRQSSTKPITDATAGAQVERRSALRRHDHQHEVNKHLGRAMEFGFMAMAGASAAVLGFGMIEETVDRPLAAVQTALAAR